MKTEIVLLNEKRIITIQIVIKTKYGIYVLPLEANDFSGKERIFIPYSSILYIINDKNNIVEVKD